MFVEGQPTETLPTQSIHSFADALEHDQTQRNADDRIKHGEQFAADRRGGGVSVTDGRQYGGRVVKGAREFPLLARFVRFRF